MRKPEKSWLAKQWAGVDNRSVCSLLNLLTAYFTICILLTLCRYFKPLLTHSYPTLMDTLPNRCLSLGRVFTSRSVLNTRF